MGTPVDVILFRCNRCSFPVALRVRRGTASPSWGVPTQFTLSREPQGPLHNVVLESIPPPPRDDQAPAHTPPNVASAYEQAARALRREDCDVAGMGFRRALDISTKHLIRAIESAAPVLGSNLNRRIEWLHAKGRLTDEIKDWAHIIRDEGNDAAHEETSYTPGEAAQLHYFTEVFLAYTFTMPETVRLYRAAADSFNRAAGAISTSA
jgi:hypothetical protein